jgi:hypothetical protein
VQGPLPDTFIGTNDAGGTAAPHELDKGPAQLHTEAARSVRQRRGDDVTPLRLPVETIRTSERRFGVPVLIRHRVPAEEDNGARVLALRAADPRYWVFIRAPWAPRQANGAFSNDRKCPKVAVRDGSLT